MKSRLGLLLSIVVAVVLLSAACSGDSESGTTTSEASNPTTTSTSETSTEPSVTTEPTTTESGTVTVYFSTGDGSDCGEVSPYTRTLLGGEPGLDSAVTELLAGPSDAERAAGASSFFSSETATSLTLVDLWRPGLAVIGFGDLQSQIPEASTSCGSEALLAQLNETALQYVPRIRYQMLGSCQMFANWLQRECMEYTSEGAEPAVLTTLERASGSGCLPWTYGVVDGRWFGYVDSTTGSEINFDLACWFDGDAAVDAASEDGEDSLPPNGYYVRNDDGTLHAIPVGSATTVSWLADIGDPSTQTAVAFGEWVTLRDSQADQPGLWLTVQDGQVVEMVEQYVP